MSFEDLGQYALGAEDRAHLYYQEENEELLRAEGVKLHSRCLTILSSGAQVEVDKIPGWARVLVFPLKRGMDRKRLSKTKTVKAPLHAGGYYPAEVIVSGSYKWVGADIKPTVERKEDLFINFIPPDSGVGEGMSSIYFSLGQDGGSMNYDQGEGEMDLGDYAMVNQLLDEFERW